MLQQQYNSVTVKGLGKRIGKVFNCRKLDANGSDGTDASMGSWRP